MQAGGLWPRRGRTDDSIRLRATAFLMFSLALKGASTDVAWIGDAGALSPTRFHREMSDSTRARQLYSDTLCQPMRPRSAIHRRCRSRCVGAISATALG